jgi:hypothetical protein
MPDKRVQWGRKAQDEERPDPNEFVFGKQAAEAGGGAPPPTTGDVPSDAGKQDTPDHSESEPMVRITVDVRKSVHKELQRVCHARELKIAQLIRQLIDRELKKSKKSQ